MGTQSPASANQVSLFADEGAPGELYMMMEREEPPPPVAVLQDPEKPFVLETDASSDQNQDESDDFLEWLDAAPDSASEFRSESSLLLLAIDTVKQHQLHKSDIVKLEQWLTTQDELQ